MKPNKPIIVSIMDLGQTSYGPNAWTKEDNTTLAIFSQ
jgi:hypothetical protein